MYVSVFIYTVRIKCIQMHDMLNGNNKKRFQIWNLLLLASFPIKFSNMCDDMIKEMGTQFQCLNLHYIKHRWLSFVPFLLSIFTCVSLTFHSFIHSLLYLYCFISFKLALLAYSIRFNRAQCNYKRATCAFLFCVYFVYSCDAHTGVLHQIKLYIFMSHGQFNFNWQLNKI